MIRNRFPTRSEIITILGIVLFVCHSWSLLGFFNRLSAFLLYFQAAEIAEIFAFMMGFAFLESLLVTGVLILLSAILPSKWLRDGFIYKGLILVGMATIALIILQRSLQGELPSLPILTLIWFTPLVWTIIFMILAERQPRVQHILLDVAERISIMLFLYVPIGVISLLVVTIRNFV